MSIFLFLKQIIDIFYGFRFADYCMATGAVILIVNQLWLNRADNGEKLKVKLLVPDICIIVISVILLINMCIQLAENQNFQMFYMYGKIGSAVLLYSLGRLCYKRIDECAFAILSSSYIIVYANLIYRIFNLGMDIFTSNDPHGDMYYYDTDMAFSITMAMIFISILGRNTIIKFFTIFAVCPFMVFHSGGDVQKVLMCVLFVILFIYMGERAVKRRKITNLILPLSIIIMMIILVMIVAPVFTGNTDGVILTFLNKYIIGTENIFNRYVAWRGLWNDIGLSSVKELLIGKGIAIGFNIENAYLSILYAIGIVGIVFAAVFVLSICGVAMRIEDRPTYYITVMLAILFLGTCMNKNGMEYTQMSWFTMLYFGMGASYSAKNKDEDVISKEEEGDYFWENADKESGESK